MSRSDPFSGHTLPELLTARASRTPERTFTWWDGEAITYQEMQVRAEITAAILQRHGVSAGERVAVLMDNRPEFLDFMFGLARTGAVQVPLNPAYRGWQIAAYMRDVNATCAVVEQAHFDALMEAIGDGAPLRSVFVVDGLPEEPPQVEIDLIDVAHGEAVSISEAGSHPARATDPYVIMATSGTTSASKGVVLCHEHEYRLAENFVEALDLVADDVFYNYFPLFHNTAQGIITWSVLLQGASMVLTPKFSQSHFWDDVQRYGCTHFFAMGPIVEFLLNDERSRTIGRSHSLKIGWGIGFSSAQAELFQSRFGVPLHTGYGLTEGSIVTFSPREDPRVESAGQVHPRFIVEVVDDHDHVLAPGEVGEIVIRPRMPYTTFLGYEGRPEETAACWRNLWLHTGDLGRFDDDGYLHYVDRKKDAIRRRGENISSYEVEWVVQQHPAVLECAAVAVPADLGRHEHEIYVAVVLEDGESLEWDELVEHCSQRLAPFAVPRFFERWEALPVTPTAKVRKVEIRERGVGGDTWDRKAQG